MLERFRASAIKAVEAADELGIGTRRLYKLYADYLRACAQRKARQWSPGRSGGSRRRSWPEKVEQCLRKLLSSRPPCSDSMIASELLRRFNFKTDRATVRRFALQHNLAPQKPAVSRKAIRRWQTQKIGQLWQYDACPHRWFYGQDWQPALLHILDDHSRVITGAKLYAKETLLAHLEFLSTTFQWAGLPLCLYVDYHSFFFAHVPEAHTQLGAALHFYGVSLRFAPTPQAKGKIERGHQFWQKRLPPLFQAEGISELSAANPLLDSLRKHHNQFEKHRELGSTPQQAWNNALKEQRSVLRPIPKCPWWNYVFSQRTRIVVGTDGRVPIGSQRLTVNSPPGTKLIRCQHPNGDITVLRESPVPGKLPIVLLSTRLC